MSHDILRAAARALQEETLRDEAGDRFTRARVLSSLHQGRQRRSLRRVVLLPLAAILIGSTAWAGATGKLPELWQRVRVRLVVPAAAAPARAELRRAALRGVAHLPTSTPKAPAPALPPPTASVAASAAPPDDIARYREAHRAHFEGHDAALALRSWDEYLRAAPSGRFAAEARYNRALCLIRLGRRAEAEAALAPFANGAYGEYRKREAQELVQALGRSGP